MKLILTTKFLAPKILYVDIISDSGGNRVMKLLTRMQLYLNSSKYFFYFICLLGNFATWKRSKLKFFTCYKIFFKKALKFENNLQHVRLCTPARTKWVKISCFRHLLDKFLKIIRKWDQAFSGSILTRSNHHMWTMYIHLMLLEEKSHIWGLFCVPVTSYHVHMHGYTEN